MSNIVWATFCGLVIIKLEGALSEIYDFLDVGLNLSVRKLQTSTVVFQVTHLIVLLSVLPKSNVYSAKLRPNDLAGLPSYLQQNCSHRRIHGWAKGSEAPPKFYQIRFLIDVFPTQKDPLG